MARFLGVDGINELEIPLPNVLVDHVHDGGGLGRGVAYWLGNGMLQTGRTAQEIAEAVSAGELALLDQPQAEEGAIRELIARECEQRMGEVSRRMEERRAWRERIGEGTPPLRVLTATGNVYEGGALGRRRGDRGTWSRDPLDRAEPPRLRAHR